MEELPGDYRGQLDVLGDVAGQGWTTVDGQR